MIAEFKPGTSQFAECLRADELPRGPHYAIGSAIVADADLPGLEALPETVVLFQ